MNKSFRKTLNSDYKCNTVAHLFHAGLSFFVLCLTGNSYRVSSTPKLHREFLKAVNQLPEIYSPENKQQFYRLIDNFGTHFITKVNQDYQKTKRSFIKLIKLEIINQIMWIYVKVYLYLLRSNWEEVFNL